MAKESLVPIGRVKDAHGIRGEVFISLKAGRADWLPSMKVLYFSHPEQGQVEFQPFKYREHKGGLIFWPHGFQNRNQAEAWKGATVFIPESYLKGDEKSGYFLGQLLGLKVVLKCEGIILGPVVGLKSNGPQDLLEVETPQGIALIPFVDAFIDQVDLEKGQIEMNLPDGLIEATTE